MLKIEAENTLNAAESYIGKGWAVMPCLPKSKEPHFGLIKRAYLDATKDLDLVKFWLNLDPNMNLGVSAIHSNLVILDVDFRNGGKVDDSWDQTFTVKTGDGVHLYYQDTNPGQYRSGITGIDVKYKGYVVTAPSIHPSGSHYEVLNDINPIPLPELVSEQICKLSW
jgi:hypothetical protein